MRQVVLYIASSLDGYIARPGGDISWLNAPEFELPGEDYGYHAFYRSIDTTLMGNATYRAVLGFDVPFPYPDRTNYVFTRSDGHRDTGFVKFISGDIPFFVRKLKDEPGKDIWLVGGGEINALLLQHGLIDRIILTLMPLTLGEGIPLFAPHTAQNRFELVETWPFSNSVIHLTWQLIPDPGLIDDPASKYAGV